MSESNERQLDALSAALLVAGELVLDDVVAIEILDELDAVGGPRARILITPSRNVVVQPLRLSGPREYLVAGMSHQPTACIYCGARSNEADLNWLESYDVWQGAEIDAAVSGGPASEADFTPPPPRWLTGRLMKMRDAVQRGGPDLSLRSVRATLAYPMDDRSDTELLNLWVLLVGGE